MSIQYDNNGQLRNAALKQINECVFWDKTRPPTIDPDPDDLLHVVKSDDRLDLLAYKFLEDVERGWIILLRNNLRLFPNDFVPGITIYIPSIDSLRQRRII